MQIKQHFALLDGLRGLAAIFVLFFHIVQQHSITALPRAGFAVDFFYLLSGFVIAYAYESRLAAGMPLSTFFTIRMIRLYPLLFIGVLAGVALAVLSTIVTGFPAPIDVASASLLGLLLLPSYVFPQWSTAYPFNMAEWSLFFEFWVNLVYALIARFLTTRLLLSLVAVSGICLIVMAYWCGGIFGGNNQDNWHLGFIRVLFPFFMGVLLFRIPRPQIQSSTLALALGFLFVVSLLIVVPGGWVTDALYVCLLLPSFLFLGAALRASEKIASGSIFLGRLSYPVYILQGSLLRIGEEVKRRVHMSGTETFTLDVGQFIGIILIAYIALICFDEPLRARLTLLFRERRTKPSLKEA